MLHFTQKFTMGAINGRKPIFGESRQMTLRITRGSKISSKLLYLKPFLRLMCFCVVQINSRLRQKWWKNNFWKKLQSHSTNALGIKTFVETTLSHTVSEINVSAEIQDDHKNCRKTIFGKSRHITLRITWGFSKIALPRTVSAIFKIFHFHHKILQKSWCSVNCSKSSKSYRFPDIYIANLLAKFHVNRQSNF